MPAERRRDQDSDHDDMRVRMIHNRSHGPHRPRAPDASPPPAKAPGGTEGATRRQRLTGAPPDPAEGDACRW